GKNIEKNIPGVKVIYTRDTDVFVELFKRAKIANENKADLFISIHCNASPYKTPSGTETYVMGLHKSQANLDVAQKENASILMEDSYSNNYDGFIPSSTEAYIIFSLFQNAYLDQSLNIATKVEKKMKEKVGMFDRGVKQAGFLVLYKTAMPSILIETGFLSNEKDEEYLSTENGQENMASSIFNAFESYKNEMEANVISSNNKKTIQNSDSNTFSKIVKDSLKASKIIITKKDSTNKNVVFKVQFASCSVKKSLKSAEFKGLSDVQEYFHNGTYKYLTGNETLPKKAISLMEKVRNIGFKDAFIVAFINDERISPQEVVKLLKKN
ncbi:MAG: N-acetylmuramoyl-L-alanine amidase, partial [Bacteroidetes bacterium]|nr:N-acetylmuramoyl-L-alanine amidase [Bacteroidota bacterium]